jgi:hypothetical protein
MPSYTNITFGQLVTLLQNRIQNLGFYSGIQYREIINGGFASLQIGSLYWKARFNAQTIAGRVFYDLTTLPGTLDANGNPQILMPLRVAFNRAPLDFCNIADMDNGLMNWQIQTTATSGAPSAPQLWGTLGLAYLYLWPADAVGGGSLQIDAAVRAPQFATDGSDDAKKVNIESGMIGPLLDYCQHIAQIPRGAEQVAATMAKLKSFMRLIGQTNSMFAASSLYKESYVQQSDRKSRMRGDLTGMVTPSTYR